MFLPHKYICVLGLQLGATIPSLYNAGTRTQDSRHARQTVYLPNDIPWAPKQGTCIETLDHRRYPHNRLPTIQKGSDLSMS